MATNIAKAKIQSLTDVNAEMAAEIAALSKRVSAPSGDRITVTAQKTFKLPNGLEVDGELEAVIVDFAAANFYYTDSFDRNNVTPPACFALGLEPAGMTPSENVPDSQAASCASCWANQFGSSGKGKACQNTRLLAILPTDATAETPLWIMKVSPTAIRAFDGHVSAVARKHGLPVRGVVTKISFSEDQWASLRFSEAALAPKDLLLEAHSRKAEAIERLLTEPDTAGGATKSVAPPKGKRPAAPAARR